MFRTHTFSLRFSVLPLGRLPRTLVLGVSECNSPSTLVLSFLDISQIPFVFCSVTLLPVCSVFHPIRSVSDRPFFVSGMLSYVNSASGTAFLDIIRKTAHSTEVPKIKDAVFQLEGSKEDRLKAFAFLKVAAKSMYTLFLSFRFCPAP